MIVASREGCDVAKVYVVTAPERVRGIYETWAACESAVKGVKGARFQSVPTREQAEALLRGEAIVLPPGLYAFIDGNHLGGVGLVIVEQVDDEPSVRESLGLTALEVLAGACLPSLGAPGAVAEALDRLRNVLAELAGLYLALRLAPEGRELTVVHDYEGVGAWMQGRWQARDPLVAEIVARCRGLASARRLTLQFRHQRAHQSSWAGRDDFAAYNVRADALASEAVRA